VQERDCAICRGINTAEHIFQDDNWLIRHSSETNILGYLILESRRHFLDLSFANESELQSYATLLARAISAVRTVIKPERVYTFTLSEAVPHYHVHIIPRTDAIPRNYRGRGILSYPLSPTADPSLRAETEDLIKRAFNRIS
jgi:diadenosine tetraphosphate (Ap4A) HIT family hydrolase